MRFSKIYQARMVKKGVFESGKVADWQFMGIDVYPPNHPPEEIPEEVGTGGTGGTSYPSATPPC